EQRKLEAAGRRERVAGVECDLFLMKTGSTPDEYCIATSLGSVAFVDTVLGRSSLSPGGAAPLERLFAHGGIVLRLRWNSADPAVTMIATSIDRRTPPATLFTVPAGYERIPD